MPESTWVHPSLWRVVVWALILGLAANTLLWSVSDSGDWFPKLIAVASGITAVALIVFWHYYTRWLDEALLVAFTIWMANVFEFMLQTNAGWDSRIRQSGFYLAEGLLALGAYVARRTNPTVVPDE